MQQGYTHITAVLDRSGSMQSTKLDAEGGFNAFLQEQRVLSGKATISLVQFDTVFEPVYEMRPIAEAPPLVLEPRGGTALLDAIGRAINGLGAQLSMLAEERRPEKVIVVIITDGGENASQEFNSDKILKMIAHQRDVYKWEFVFIGANQDAIATAASLGIGAGSALSYAANAVGTRSAYDSLSNATAAFRNGDAVNVSFSEEDRRRQEQAVA